MGLPDLGVAAQQDPGAAKRQGVVRPFARERKEEIPVPVLLKHFTAQYADRFGRPAPEVSLDPFAGLYALPLTRQSA
jgi:hypothetical protein